LDSKFTIVSRRPERKEAVATHYGSMGNQSRMRAPEADAKAIRFRFADITNLKHPGDGHIRDLTVTFLDSAGTGVTVR
jgi:hypothetical protein